MKRRKLVASRQPSAVSHRPSTAFTLVEMLIAMAITLVMIGAVVTLFANISNSVRNRRAVVELSGQMRHARNMLQQDLAGATCNGLVWQRPDENQGYIEIIEGPQREGQASLLVDGEPEENTPGPDYNPEIDHQTSILPASNVPFDPTWHTDGGSLGDGDDILMLTVRNEHEPFVGRVPLADGTATAVRFNTTNPKPYVEWQPTTATSPLAEVVWYAVENPHEDANVDNFFGEPGMRTIHRRALLIAPWLNPYRAVDSSTGNFVDTFTYDGADFTAQPGLLRILTKDIDNSDAANRAKALASLIAFQETFDISARLEWDPLLDAPNGRWKIVANTLGDLTKRENRYEHHFFRHDSGREYPFAVASTGSEYDGTNVAIVSDPEIVTAYPVATPADVDAVLRDDVFDDTVVDFVINMPNTANGPYHLRPLVYVAEDSITVATARAMLNDEGKVVRVVHGLAPLSGARRGEDVMLTDALGFDLRVYDPGAPLFAHRVTETILEPTDPAWLNAYVHTDNMDDDGTGFIGAGNTDTNPTFPFVGQGAYVDLGYGYNELAKNLSPAVTNAPFLPVPRFANAFTSSTIPWFFTRRTLSDVYGDQLAPGYAVFDTWSFHYENNGVNEDRYRLLGSSWSDDDALTDEGTNGLDDPGSYSDGAFLTRLGPDDIGERETIPPYDKPLRGLQAVLRLYERDSRQVRQVSVNQSFVPE